MSCFLCTVLYIWLAHKPDIICCNCSNHDRARFYGKIQITFGLWDSVQSHKYQQSSKFFSYFAKLTNNIYLGFCLTIFRKRRCFRVSYIFKLACTVHCTNYKKSNFIYSFYIQFLTFNYCSVLYTLYDIYSYLFTPVDHIAG